jgi:putative mRNA 3-end processing factor
VGVLAAYPVGKTQRLLAGLDPACGPVAQASGWMAIWKARRGGREPLARGFVLSDHADWNGLLAAIAAGGARRIGVTHRQVDPFVRYLRESGIDAFGG